MKSKLREEVVRLRINEELSYSEIQKKFAIPKSTLSYWLKDMPLSKERISYLRAKGRKNAEPRIEEFRNSMRLKKEKEDHRVYKKYIKEFEKIADSENIFFIAGLMIYLGEGNKKNKNRVNIANTDVETINFFLKWIVHFLDVSKKDIRIQLHLYEDMKIEKEQDFWIKELGVPLKQFYKTQIRKLKKGSFSYKDSFGHGTCSVYILNTHVKREIMMSIKAFFKVF